jgi:hypothetical protein
MSHHLTSFHASIWDIVEFGVQVPSVGDEGYDSDFGRGRPNPALQLLSHYYTPRLSMSRGV